MSTLFAALKAIWDFALGAIADFFVWLRTPGHKVKFVAGVLAFFLAIAAMRAWQAEQALAAFALQCEADKGTLRQDITLRDQSIAEINANAKAERDKRDAQILRAEQARKEAERKAKAAEASLQAFEAEYANRPPACQQALATLATACSTLRDY